MIRLRGFHLRASRYGGQVAASARQALATGAVVMIGGSSSVFACPVCFGAEETSMIDGARLGVLVMLAILFAVQGGFVGFFFYLRQLGSGGHIQIFSFLRGERVYFAFQPDCLLPRAFFHGA